MTLRHSSIPAMHPGEILREDFLPALGRPKAEIARLLGVSRNTLYNLLDEKQAVTAEMAVRLGKLLGGGPGIWVRLQGNHDIWKAEQSVDTSAIPTLQAAE